MRKVEKYKDLETGFNTVKHLQGLIDENLIDTEKKIDQVEQNVDQVDENVTDAKDNLKEAYHENTKKNHNVVRLGTSAAGGVIGLVGGPLGVLVGAGIGLITGNFAVKGIVSRNKDQINTMEDNLEKANKN